VTLVFKANVALPRHAAGGFDHGDVHPGTGRVFVAHTANGTLEVVDGERLRLERTLPGCAEASGVLYAANGGEVVFAAARGDGAVLKVDPNTCEQLGQFPVGPKPNGLAWDHDRGQMLVADVETFDARLLDPQTGTCLVVHELPGRPRWTVYDAPRRRFLVNIREPACVVALAAESLEETVRIEGLAAGPHGLDVDRSGERAFVACDAATVCVLDLTTDRETTRVPISGEPDAVWYSATAQSLYVAIGKPGVVYVIDTNAFTVAQQVVTEEGAHTTAFDSQRRRLYVFLPRSCQAAVYEETTPAVV
jgi:DNA-binding beta-propeller fold protein YncE